MIGVQFINRGLCGVIVSCLRTLRLCVSQGVFTQSRKERKGRKTIRVSQFSKNIIFVELTHDPKNKKLTICRARASNVVLIISFFEVSIYG